METQFATGLASAGDSYASGHEAAMEAYEKLQTSRVDCCHVCVSATFRYDEVLAGIRAVVGEDATIFGCSSTGEFTESETHTESVALALVASDTLRFFAGLGTGLRDDPRKAVAQATRNLPGTVDGYPNQAAICLHDGLAGVGDQLAVLAQQQLGYNVSLAGGSAGDDRHMDGTHVFLDSEIRRDATVITEIASKQPVVVTVNHGHAPISESMVVTESRGNVVREIDGRPAFEVWREAVRPYAREEFGVDVDDMTDDERTRMLTAYQFGVDQGAELKVRWPGATQTTDGPLRFPTHLPAGTVVRVMHSPAEQQLEALQAAAREARERAAGIDIAGAFVYDCFCRSEILGDSFPDAIDVLASELEVPFVGLETYGEICIEVGQMSGYHNSTTVIVQLPA